MSLRPLSEVVEEHYSWATSDTYRIPLGWSFFDDATGGGVALGEVCMMLAYSGVGKTWWAVNVALNRLNVPTVFFSLEMQARSLVQRMAAVAYGVTTHSIEDEVRETGSSQYLEKLVGDYPLLMINDEPSLGLAGMGDSLKRASDIWGEAPKLVLVDYMELVRAGPALGSLEQIDRVSRNLKNFSRDYDVALVVLHQTNANEAARISDFGGGRGGSRVDAGHQPLTRKAARFGGDVAADYTIGCYKPTLDPNMPETIRSIRENEFWMQLLKNRGGNQLHLAGVEHHVDIDCWRITEKEVTYDQPTWATEPEEGWPERAEGDWESAITSVQPEGGTELSE